MDGNKAINVLMGKIQDSGMISGLKNRNNIEIQVVDSVITFIKISNKKKLFSFAPIEHTDESVNEVNYLITYSFYCAYYNTAVLGENFVNSFIFKIFNEYFKNKGYTIIYSQQTFEIKNNELGVKTIVQYDV
jgi:hypothetical protein